MKLLFANRIKIFFLCFGRLLVFSLFAMKLLAQKNDNSTILLQLADSIYENGSAEVAINAYDDVLDKANKSQDWASYISGLIGKAYCYEDLSQIVLADDLLDNELRRLEKIVTVPKKELAQAYAIHGYVCRKKNDYAKSLLSYEKAIEILSKSGENNSILTFSYKNAATIHVRRLDYSKAIAYLNKGIEIDSGKDYHAELYYEMAICFLLNNDYDNVEICYNKGQKFMSSQLDIAHFNIIYASSLFEKRRYFEAKKLILSSIGHFKNDVDLLDNLARLYSMLGQIEDSQKNHEAASDWYWLGIRALSSEFENKNRELARIHHYLGESFHNQNLLDSALAHYQQALIQVFPNFNSTNVADNPDLKDVYTESWIMTAAARKAEALHRRYQQRGNLADLHNAAYCYDLSLAAVKELHKSYGSDAAKLYMGDYSHNYWEEAIEVNFLLYSKTGNHANLEKIFSLMEKSKASVLSEAIQKNRALLLLGIPDSLLEREKDLRITIAELTTQLRNTEVEGQGSGEALAKVKGQLSDAHLEHERLLESLKNTYPSFKAFVEDAPLPTLDEARANLTKEGQVFAEYFAGKAAIYCLYFDKKGANVFKIDRTEALNKTLQEYLAFFSDGNAILVNPAAYLCVANELYDLLVVKIFAREKAQKVVLALDGILGFLPFDALVVKDEGIKMGFNKVDFLIKNVELRYAYSANVLLQQMENRQSKGYFLRIMPRFADGERGLAPLSFSDEETAGVHAWTSLNGKDATKIGFRKLAEKSWLIHLSTHADSDGEQGEPFIEMADGRLMLSELYAMNLTATDLVILSACETGLGKVERGEGVMSLARGFAYAGANSLVASQWKVNERSTALLFQRFYLYLKAGKTKSEALRLAKLWALENAGTDARQSPYYWAGFIFMGCDGKMELPNKWQNWGLAAGGFGLVFGTLFFLRRRQRKITA